MGSYEQASSLTYKSKLLQEKTLVMLVPGMSQLRVLTPTDGEVCKVDEEHTEQD